MQLIKPLIIISNPVIGGTETLLLSLTPHLEKLNCRPDILNTWRDSLMKKEALERQLSYTELSSNSRYIRLRDLARIVQIIRRGKYDMVLCFGFRINMLVRLLKPFFYDIPFLVGLHGLDIWRKWYHVWLDRLTRSGCDMFIPISAAVAEKCMARERYPFDKIVVIPNGTDVDEFDKNHFGSVTRQKLGLPPDKIIITTIASFRYEKGHDFYLEVIKAFLSRLANVHFVWIGMGPLKDKIETTISRMGATDKFTLMGLVDDVRPTLTCSDMFVLPSRAEGMPRALMEAMAMSLPCVASNVGGVREVIENGISGFIGEFGDVEGFGGQLIKLVRDSELRLRIGMAARERIVSNFSMKAIAIKYAALFKLILEGQRDGREIQRRLDALSCSIS